MEITVHTATITHRHGADTVLATSEKALAVEILEYIGQWWNDYCEGQPQPEDPQEAIDLYFSNADGHEYCDIGTSAIEVPDPYADLREALTRSLAWLEDTAVRHEIRSKQGNAAIYDSLIKRAKVALR